MEGLKQEKRRSPSQNRRFWQLLGEAKCQAGVTVTVTVTYSRCYLADVGLIGSDLGNTAEKNHKVQSANKPYLISKGLIALLRLKEG